MPTYDETVGLGATSSLLDTGSGSVIKGDPIALRALTFLLMAAPKTVATDEVGLDATTLMALATVLVAKESILDWALMSAFDVSDRDILKNQITLHATPTLLVTHEGIEVVFLRSIIRSALLAT